jgi:hypothetical protein
MSSTSSLLLFLILSINKSIICPRTSCVRTAVHKYSTICPPQGIYLYLCSNHFYSLIIVATLFVVIMILCLHLFYNDVFDIRPANWPFFILTRGSRSYIQLLLIKMIKLHDLSLNWKSKHRKLYRIYDFI